MTFRTECQVHLPERQAQFQMQWPKELHKEWSTGPRTKQNRNRPLIFRGASPPQWAKVKVVGLKVMMKPVAVEIAGETAAAIPTAVTIPTAVMVAIAVKIANVAAVAFATAVAKALNRARETRHSLKTADRKLRSMRKPVRRAPKAEPAAMSVIAISVIAISVIAISVIAMSVLDLSVNAIYVIGVPSTP